MYGEFLKVFDLAQNSQATSGTDGKAPGEVIGNGGAEPSNLNATALSDGGGTTMTDCGGRLERI
jgi:hypothetical protein